MYLKIHIEDSILQVNAKFFNLTSHMDILQWVDRLEEAYGFVVEVIT